jgi:hypothetical protein
MSAESAAFYSTAAQVLPVLFLAIAFEQGFWRSSEATRVFGLQTGRVPTGRFARAAAALMLLFPIVLFVGEWLALMAVNGNEVEVARYFVTGALVLAGIVVALPPLWVGLPAWLPTRPTDDRLDFTFARAVIVALAVGCAAFTALGIVLAIF